MVYFHFKISFFCDVAPCTFVDTHTSTPFTTEFLLKKKHMKFKEIGEKTPGL
jgi:hypothetical protein